jgi:broad specificity phosphatase PhoE
MVDLYLVRHGQSDMQNKTNLVCGRSIDSLLSEKGVQQAIKLGIRVEDECIHFDDVYVSTAKRAIDTAINTGFSIDKIIPSEEILELSMGEWEGMPRKNVYTQDVYRLINQDCWNFAPPGGESQKQVEERMLKFVNYYVISNEKENKTIGLFTHNFAIKCLLRGIMDFSPKMTYKIRIDNTSITRLKYDNRGWHVININDASHLTKYFM